MSIEELRNYYRDIEECYGNCNCCYHYYLCDYITELLLNPNENEEEINNLTTEQLNRL